MWREYSLNSIKSNRAAGASIAVAALIASVLLSLTTGVFYNIWADEVNAIALEEGDWQAKLSGSLTEEGLEIIRRHPNVRAAVPGEATGGAQTVFVYLANPRTVYQDLPKIAAEIGPVGDGKTPEIQYHSELLSLWLIFSPERGEGPPPVLVAYLAIALTACAALVMIIHNAFQVSMDARIRQLGILKSVGATPRQIRSALVFEALALCLVPVILGTAAGAGLTYGFMAFIRSVVNPVRAREVAFRYRSSVALAALALSGLTVWLSALIPARRISRLSPLEALRYGADRPAKKMRRFRIASAFLGIEGELARKSMHGRRRAFRTAILSLTLASLVFFSFVNLEAISGISTKYTYFERYKDRWDLMLTMDGAEGGEALAAEIRKIEGVSSCVAFRSISASAWLTWDMLSPELTALGGPDALEDAGIRRENGRYRVKTPILVLDDESFAAYRRDAGTGAETGDAPRVVAVNAIWDSVHSNRRDRKMIPFLGEARGLVLGLYPAGGDARDSGGLPVQIAAYARAEPEIRQEFDNFSLPLIMAESAWRPFVDRFKSGAVSYNIRVAAPDTVPAVEGRIEALLPEGAEYALENRLQTEAYNVSVRNALKLVVGALAALLALIGLGGVFSCALGLIHQRRREFARYIALGLTPGGVRKVLISEAAIVALKPLLISLLVNVPIVWAALNVSLIPASDFFAGMPLMPVAAFAAAVILSVGLAYFVGGKKLCAQDLAGILKDETMV